MTWIRSFCMACGVSTVFGVSVESESSAPLMRHWGRHAAAVQSSGAVHVSTDATTSTLMRSRTQRGRTISVELQAPSSYVEGSSSESASAHVKEDDDQEACEDTWVEEWGSTPHQRCQEWSQDSRWGALKNGKTLKEACNHVWSRTNCAKTCGCQSACVCDGTYGTYWRDGNGKKWFRNNSERFGGSCGDADGSGKGNWCYVSNGNSNDYKGPCKDATKGTSFHKDDPHQLYYSYAACEACVCDGTYGTHWRDRNGNQWNRSSSERFGGSCGDPDGSGKAWCYVSNGNSNDYKGPCKDATKGTSFHEDNPHNLYYSYAACKVCGYGEDMCRTQAAKMNLILGGAGFDFKGDYSTTGCYAYTSGKYAGRAYYGVADGGGDVQSGDQLTGLKGNTYRVKGTFSCGEPTPSPTPSPTPTPTKPDCAYECGTPIADDCQSEYDHAKSSGDMTAFHARCAEDSKYPLRHRCKLCCDHCKASSSL